MSKIFIPSSILITLILNHLKECKNILISDKVQRQSQPLIVSF